MSQDQQYLYDALFEIADVTSERVHDALASSQECAVVLGALAAGMVLLHDGTPREGENVDEARLCKRLAGLVEYSPAYTGVRDRVMRRDAGLPTPTIVRLAEDIVERAQLQVTGDRTGLLQALALAADIASRHSEARRATDVELIWVFTAVLHGLRFVRSEDCNHLRLDVVYRLQWLAERMPEYADALPLAK